MQMTASKPTTNESSKIESLFSKEQLLESARFQHRKDLINALLACDKQYTIEMVEQMIEQYLKGKVK